MRLIWCHVTPEARCPPSLWGEQYDEQSYPEQARHGDDGPAQADCRAERAPHEQDHRPSTRPRLKHTLEPVARQPRGKQLGKIDRVSRVHSQNEEGHHGQEPEGLGIGSCAAETQPVPRSRLPHDRRRRRTDGLRHEASGAKASSPSSPPVKDENRLRHDADPAEPVAEHAEEEPAHRAPEQEGARPRLPCHSIAAGLPPVSSVNIGVLKIVNNCPS